MKFAFLDDRIYGYAVCDPSATGGAERQQWLLARALAASGCHVTCGLRTGLQPAERVRVSGVEFLGMDDCHVARAWSRFLSAERPHWLYWRSADHLLGLAVEVAQRAAVRTIFAAAFDTDVRPRDALTRRRAWWPLYAWGLQRADKLFVQHAQQFAALGSRWQRKAVVVPGIAGSVGRVNHHSRRGQYIAWVGMLRKPKRPDVLVRIAAALPDMHFVICGGPTTHRTADGYSQRVMDDLRGLPNVRFIGQVAANVAAEVIADAALLLSTSDQEGFPNTFLQAWASGTPVVTLTIDPDGVIKRFGLGTVSGDVSGVLADISALVASPSMRQEVAMRARSYVETVHAEAAVVRIVQRALQE